MSGSTPSPNSCEKSLAFNLIFSIFCGMTFCFSLMNMSQYMGYSGAIKTLTKLKENDTIDEKILNSETTSLKSHFAMTGGFSAVVTFLMIFFLIYNAAMFGSNENFTDTDSEEKPRKRRKNKRDRR